VRVLARVLGNDLARLVDYISAAVSVSFSAADARAVALHFEAEFAAGVLASLALDPLLAGRIVSDGFLDRIIAFLHVPLRTNDDAACCFSLDSKVCASLCQVLRRVSSHSEEHLTAVLQAKGLEAMIKVARAAGAGNCIVEGMAACGDIILDCTHVAIVDAPCCLPDGGTRGVAWAVGVLDRRGSTEPAIAICCFHFIHAVQVIVKN
jgi:hypothetical protein